MTSKPTGSSPAFTYSFSLPLQGADTPTPLGQIDGLFVWLLQTDNKGAASQDSGIAAYNTLASGLPETKGNQGTKLENLDLPFPTGTAKKEMWDSCCHIPQPCVKHLFKHKEPWIPSVICSFCPKTFHSKMHMLSFSQWALLFFLRLYIDRRDWSNCSPNQRNQASKPRESVLRLWISLLKGLNLEAFLDI